MKSTKMIPYLQALLLLMPHLLLAASAKKYHGPTAPRISVYDIQKNNINLHNVLHESGGVIRISTTHSSTTPQGLVDDNLIHNIASYRKEALSSLCTCSAFSKSPHSDDLFKQLLEAYPKDIQQIELPDGSTRRTLATATVGFDNNNADAASSHSLELPAWLKNQCGHNAYESMENLRDAVSKVVSLFIGKLDNEKQRDQSYRQVLQSANHLEHFHVYNKIDDTFTEGTPVMKKEDSQILKGNDGLSTGGKSQEATLDYHTDAGFFLSFVPAMNCHSYSVDESSFYLKSQEQPLAFEEDEVVILMGAGAQYWMNSDTDSSNESLVAAPHALQLSPGAHRSWYGKMHLLPSSFASNAFHNPTTMGSPSPVRYGDILPTFKLDNYKAHVTSTVVDGCGITSLGPINNATSIASTRRRLQHVGSPANCNNETNFFCWYQCLSIPNADFTLDYLRDGYSLYCLDPSMLGDNSVANAAAPCKNGYTHNADCSGSWQLTDKNLAGYDFPNHAAALKQEEESATAAGYPLPDDGDEYCYGGTSMYMDGFNWIGSTCVIYLFPQWVLSTPGKFALACLGSILFGILLEYVLWKRRAVYIMAPGRRRLILSVLVYGLQLSMGYFIMLVIMTYSGPLFVSTVGGMMLGHALFNAQDSYMKWRDGSATKSQDAGAGTSEMGPTERGSTELADAYQNVRTSSRNSSEVDDEVEAGCCGLGKSASPEKSYGATEKTKLKESIPEGATPCCQYVL